VDQRGEGVGKRGRADLVAEEEEKAAAETNGAGRLSIAVAVKEAGVKLKGAARAGDGAGSGRDSARLQKGGGRSARLRVGTWVRARAFASRHKLINAYLRPRVKEDP
jgi:hypothetical protein